MLQSEVGYSFLLLGQDVVAEVQVLVAVDELVEVNVDGPGSDVLVKVEVVVGGLDLVVNDGAVLEGLPRNVDDVRLKVLPKLVKHLYLLLLGEDAAHVQPVLAECC